MKASSKLHDWYYKPGELIKSIGFYRNPYRYWDQSSFDHIFATDHAANLYIGQYSVYPEHFKEYFGDFAKAEAGFLLYTTEKPGIILSKVIDTNVNHLNQRLRLLAQRLVDYGMPLSSVILSPVIDLGGPTLNHILKGVFTIRPE